MTTQPPHSKRRGIHRRPQRILAEDFSDYLRNFDLDTLDEHGATIYGLRHDLTFAYANASWTKFACDNDGAHYLTDPAWLLGKFILSFIAEPLRLFYETTFRDVVQTNTTAVHDYDCSTPNKVRFFHMDILPLKSPTRRNRGLLIINSHAPPPKPFPLRNTVDEPDPDAYLTEDQLLVSCSHCRRFRRRDDPNTWDWLPNYLESPPAPVSHGLCEVCLDHYYASSP